MDAEAETGAAAPEVVTDPVVEGDGETSESMPATEPDPTGAQPDGATGNGTDEEAASGSAAYDPVQEVGEGSDAVSAEPVRAGARAETGADGAATSDDQQAPEDELAATDAADRPEPDVSAAEDVPEALSVEGFEMDKVVEMIEESDLGPAEKSLLKKGVEEAASDPEALKAVLDKIRAALDL